MNVSSVVTFGLIAWFAVGLVVGGAFVAVRASHLVEGVRGSSLAFRLLILPGAMTLWPVILVRWRADRSEP